MKYFKDKNNQIYALDEKDVAEFKKSEWIEISKKEVDEILNPAPNEEQIKQKELAELDEQIKETEGYIRHALLIGNDNVLDELRAEYKELLAQKENLEKGESDEK
ncbi:MULTISPECIES: hypothetical protein [Campylobacter]|uniref:hypothetical protein n=1 Tax=Campylobacter TaxID=194 RepID=UPI00027A3743|nr:MULTISPECIES: hypothetical protein [Campylobacter]EJP74525.1 hypothetical protein HMPREF1139_1253 [Campylobacter sp. FOBRC14]